MYVDPFLPRVVSGWTSRHLGMDMPIVSYGDRGHPLLLVPTAQADFLENERYSLIKAIEPHIFAGKVRVFSIDSINRHAWMNREVTVAEAARQQALYSSYVEEEVVPFIQNASGGRRIAISGASFGAFHAANLFFRHPDFFDALIAMSGFYDLQPDYTHGYMDDNLYFNNPMSYVPNLNDPEVLDLLRRDCDIHLLTGQGAYEMPMASHVFSQVLWKKGIWHNLDVWGHDVTHDWPWWRKMLDHYVGSRLSW